MLFHPSQVARVVLLALALHFSFSSAELSRHDPNASGTVHVRNERGLPELSGNVNFKYRNPSAESPAPSTTSYAAPIADTMAPTFQITEQELKNLLGIKLEFDLNIDVVYNHDDAVDRALGMGRIPVHIKIHELTIGGILAPSLTVKDINLQSDPVNYGNIRVI
ncbi:hypothetical protein BG000_010714 [Podila horticola]|nr:hypothetical protein BG000_010714 [Podila horticola]